MGEGEKLGLQRDEERGMSRRRFLARGAAFAFAAAVTGPGLTVLSGCGGSSSGGALKFWQFYGPGGEVKAQGKWFSDTVKGWNESHDTKIELQYIPVTEYLNGSKLQTAFSSGEGPDLFIISPGDFLRYYNGGVLQDLTPYIKDEAQKDLYPNVMATRVVDGKIYGIPMEVEPMAMYYSVKAFEEAGLSEADLPQTWDALLDVAGTLKKGDRFGVLFDTNPGYYQNFTWYPFMWQGGGDAVAANGKESAFDSKGAVQALAFWQEAVESEVAPRKALGTGANDIVANLAQDYCAIQNCGIWAVAALEANAPDFEYGTFKLPLPQGGRYTTDLGGWAFVANSKGKNPEEAGRFCAWALASMSPQSVERGVDWIAGADSTVAPRKSVQQKAEQEGAFDEGPMKFFREEAFPGGRGEPRYTPEVYKAVSDAIQACQLDGADPQSRADQAAEQINTFLEGYSGARIV
ncbi:MAG: sugar ABC transporter substrate-binding protein [Actinomycetota bacterium]|nr:sugar ABC transporter substrate-binding protein [Actinomycetota bacterium]